MSVKGSSKCEPCEAGHYQDQVCVYVCMCGVVRFCVLCVYVSVVCYVCMRMLCAVVCVCGCMLCAFLCGKLKI